MFAWKPRVIDAAGINLDEHPFNPSIQKLNIAALRLVWSHIHDQRTDNETSTGGSGARHQQD
jgi:hypothetical protein